MRCAVNPGATPQPSMLRVPHPQFPLLSDREPLAFIIYTRKSLSRDLQLLEVLQYGLGGQSCLNVLLCGSQCGLGQRPAHFEEPCRRAPADGTTYTTIQQTSLICWIVTLSTHIVLSVLSGQCGHLERRHAAKRTTFLCVCQVGGPAQDAGTKPTLTCNSFKESLRRARAAGKIDSPAAHEPPK